MKCYIQKKISYTYNIKKDIWKHASIYKDSTIKTSFKSELSSNQLHYVQSNEDSRT